MNEKNPYENDDTVEIPDFSSIKVNDDDIDRSVFKISDDTATTSFDDQLEDDEDDEEYEDYDEEVSYRRVKKSGIVLMSAVMVILLVLAVFGMFWGISKNKAYTSLKSDYDAYVADKSAEITELNNKITELQSQSSNSGSTTNTDSTTAQTSTYKVSADVVKIRSKATVDSDWVAYSSLSSSVQSVVHQNADGQSYATKDDVLTVYETANDSSGNTWARIDTSAWIAVVYEGATWASAQ